MLSWMLQLFWRVRDSGSSVLNSMILMQPKFGDFFQMPRLFSLANSSACFSSL